MGPLDFLMGGGSSAPLGNPLVKALLAKHGAVVPDAGPGVAPNAGPAPVGSDIATPEARTANVFDNLDLGDANPGGDLMGGIKDSLAANAAKPRDGFLQRIGDFLHSDEGRATAMRFAAGAFKGGMGGGLEAATNFADQRHHEAAAATAANADRAERGREFDENHEFHLGQLDATREQNRETAEHNRRGDMNDSRRISADLYKHDNASGDERMRSQTSIYQHLNPSGDTRLNVGERQYEHDNVSGDVDAQQAGENARATAGNQTEIMKARIGAAPTSSVHAHYTTTPAEYAANGPRLRPSEVRPAPVETPGDANAAVHHIANDDQYNALPSGARFQGPDGQIRVKP